MLLRDTTLQSNWHRCDTRQLIFAFKALRYS
jgi:hypothetical protein